MQVVRKPATIGHNGEGELALFVAPLAGTPKFDGYSYAASEREITLHGAGRPIGVYAIEQGIASEALERGYDRDLLVVQQYPDGRLAAEEQLVPRATVGGLRS